ncbi:hypothetical protein KPSA1_02414 [Pseudomonas syringae pv. actinidiae]|uniref:Uncharacterized protein n=1 Tax=Pseudomonas syringae pv. actinidiae TaxID=103796 RepID=A0A2V0QKB8_PSESF|nr:hypothetical protein KPSA1_02414 [Pseudomonas syringae pv. actinidiae]
MSGLSERLPLTHVMSCLGPASVRDRRDAMKSERIGACRSMATAI